MPSDPSAGGKTIHQPGGLLSQVRSMTTRPQASQANLRATVRGSPSSGWRDMAWSLGHRPGVPTFSPLAMPFGWSFWANAAR